LNPPKERPWRSRTPSSQRGGSTRRPSPCTARSPDGQDPRLGRHDRPAPTVRNPHPTTAPPGHGVPRQDRHDLIQLS
jgi:hypothetical protein